MSIAAYGNHIGGRQVPARSEGTLDVTNPATGQTWATIPDSGADDIAAAVDAATGAFPGWSRLDAKARAAICGPWPRSPGPTSANWPTWRRGTRGGSSRRRCTGTSRCVWRSCTSSPGRPTSCTVRPSTWVRRASTSPGASPSVSSAWSSRGTPRCRSSCRRRQQRWRRGTPWSSSLQSRRAARSSAGPRCSRKPGSRPGSSTSWPAGVRSSVTRWCVIATSPGSASRGPPRPLGPSWRRLPGP